MKKIFDQEKLDIKFMNLAINLAKKNIGKTAENPSVGCVITQNNVIISTGVTSESGRPHAEFCAMSKIKNKNLSNLTMYVTLEPCFHHGKTSPCVELIDKTIFSRIIISCIDPDPRVNGQSIKYLQDIGLLVEVGLIKDEYKRINRAFFQAKLAKKPFISLKTATTIDGKIATKDFESKWISCKESRQYSNFLRSKNDAILIGSKTLKKDNPLLSCRIKGLEKYSATPIIMSNSLDFDLNYQIFKKHKKIIIATKNKELEKQQKYSELQNLQIIQYNNLNELLENLAKLGINSILIEGGAQIYASFLKENLIDEIIHVQSGKILGSEAIDSIGNLNIIKLTQSPNFSIISSREYFSDKITIWQKDF